MKFSGIFFSLLMALPVTAQLPPSIVSPASNPAPTPTPTPPATISFAAVRTDYHSYQGKTVWVHGFVNVADVSINNGPQTHFGFEIQDKTKQWRGIFDADKRNAKTMALRNRILEKGRGWCALLIRLPADGRFLFHEGIMTGELLDWTFLGK